jgi:DNA polymerase III sliding clamp (beta) subunit (PCNA family)
LADDQLSLELNGPLNPGILRAGDSFLYIVMPMQA